jgi:hypothetical protein
LPVYINAEQVSQDELHPITDEFSLFNVEDAVFKPGSHSSSFRLHRSPNLPTGFLSLVDVNDTDEANFEKSKPFKLMKAVTFWGRKKKREESK